MFSLILEFITISLLCCYNQSILIFVYILQSDSESDMNNLVSKRLGGLMRPTISSQNKTNNGNLGNKNQSLSANKFSKSSKTGSANRRRMQNSYSSGKFYWFLNQE